MTQKPITSVGDVQKEGKALSLFANLRFTPNQSDAWLLYHMLKRLPGGSELYLTQGQTFSHLFDAETPIENANIYARKINVATLIHDIEATLNTLPEDANIWQRMNSVTRSMQTRAQGKYFVNINPHAKDSVWPALPKDVDIVMQCVIPPGGRDRSREALCAILPDSFHFNSGEGERIADKSQLPSLIETIRERVSDEAAEAICKTELAGSSEEIETLLDTLAINDKGIILKHPFSLGGNAIYRVYRKPDNDAIEVEFTPPGSVAKGKPVTMKRCSLQELLEQPYIKSALDKGMKLAAMPCLDTSKGDTRILVANGEIVAAYNRVPSDNIAHATGQEDSGWRMCNIDKGASAEPYEITNAERERLRPLLRFLDSEYGMHFFSLDMLANEDNTRFITEINHDVPSIKYMSAIETPAGRDAEDPVIQRVVDAVFESYAHDKTRRTGQQVG